MCTAFPLPIHQLRNIQAGFKTPSAGNETPLYECRPGRFYRPHVHMYKTIKKTIILSFGFPPELNGKTLLLNTPHNFIIGHWKIKLELR